MKLKDYLQPIFTLLKYIVIGTSVIVLFDLNHNTLRLTLYRVSLYPDTEPFDEKMRIFDVVLLSGIVIIIYVLLSVHHKWQTHKLECRKLQGKKENDDIMRKVLVDEIDRILQSSEKINFNEVKLRRRSFSCTRNKNNYRANQSDSSELDTTN